MFDFLKKLFGGKSESETTTTDNTTPVNTTKEEASATENKTYTFVAPITGKSVPLSEVPDPVFAEKMTGDGVAIMPEDDIVVAPADGELTLVFNTKHAFAMTLDNGIELLIHFGLETVSLNGEGFETLAKQGDRLKAGDPILKVDREFLKSKGLQTITPVLITNPDVLKSLTPVENVATVAGETTILEYTL